MDTPTLRTPRLFLRPWSPDDAEALYKILQEKDVLRYLPNTNPPPLEKVEKYITRQLTHWQEGGYGHWAVVSQENGLLLGWNGLEYLPEVNETEVAYLLRKNAWGYGFATEAAQAAVQFGFDSAGLDTIIGLVHPDNIASSRVLEKSGLTYADKINLWGLDLNRYRIHKPGYGAPRRSSA
jgi:ribosomal-protein-alanine N-acetyltransferase